jgi:hypothetical protein
MNLHDLQAWQISLIVTAIVVLVESAVSVVARRWRPRLPAQWRTALLLLLLILAGILFVRTLGASRADHLANVAAAIGTLTTLWLTYRSFNTSREERSEAQADYSEPSEETRSEPGHSEQAGAFQRSSQPAPPVPKDKDQVSEKEATTRSDQGPWAEWLRSRRKTRHRG